MTRWRVLLLALAAMLFAVSGVARAAPTPGSPPPCHAMVQAAQHHAPRPEAPAHDMAAMNCCLGCLPGLAAPTPLAGPAQRPLTIAFDLFQTLQDGLSTPPELGPPRPGLD
jgi:hypothetical protein